MRANFFRTSNKVLWPPLLDVFLDLPRPRKHRHRDGIKRILEGNTADENADGVDFFRLCLSLSAVPNQRRLGGRQAWTAARSDHLRHHLGRGGDDDGCGSRRGDAVHRPRRSGIWRGCDLSYRNAGDVVMDAEVAPRLCSGHHTRVFTFGQLHHTLAGGNVDCRDLVARIVHCVGVVSLFWAVAWGLYFRDDPACHKGMTSEEIQTLPPYTANKGELQVPWKPLGVRMIPVIVVYFCYGWTLWLFLSWIPSFFKNEYHLDLQKSALFASGVFLSGVFGDTLGGIVSDKLFERTKNLNIARRNLVAVMMVLCCISLVPILFTNNIKLVALALSAGFFCAEFTVGPMWAIPMDIAPKYSGTASGMMNTGSALAAIVSPVVFGYIVDKTGHWTWPFLGSMALMLFGAALSFAIHPDRPLSEETVPAIPMAVGR